MRGLVAIWRRRIVLLALASLYFGVVLPCAFVLRLTGRDALLLREAPRASSYWRRLPPRSRSGTSRHPY